MGHFLRRGDVLLFRSAKKLGPVVREGQRRPGQRYPPAVNHAAIVTRSGEPAIEPVAEIVEAAYPVVRRVALYPQHADDMVWSYRPLWIPSEDLEDIVRRIEARVGDPYPYLDLLTTGIDIKLFGGRPVTSWLTRWTWGSKCTGMVAEEFERRNRDHRITAERGWFATPAGIERWFLDRPRSFVCTWNGFPREWRAA